MMSVKRRFRQAAGYGRAAIPSIAPKILAKGQEEAMKPGVYYVVDLIHAGMDGAVTAGKTAIVPQAAVRTALAAIAVGAGLGAATAALDRKSKFELAAKSLIGGAVGLGCGLAWASRKYAVVAARGAARRIGTVRDARWLEKNPIDFA
jgi:ABC-type Fe3+-siderophore transport system permease subunit